MNKLEKFGRPDLFNEMKYKVDVWINARDSPNLPCKLRPIGFTIKAFKMDYIELELKGAGDFPDGAWVTSEELESFIDKLTQIVEKINGLPLSLSQDVTVLWHKRDESNE